MPAGSLLSFCTDTLGIMLGTRFRACLSLQEAYSPGGVTAGGQLGEQRQGKRKEGMAMSHWASSVHISSAAPCWQEEAATGGGSSWGCGHSPALRAGHLWSGDKPSTGTYYDFQPPCLSREANKSLSTYR